MLWLKIKQQLRPRELATLNHGYTWHKASRAYFCYIVHWMKIQIWRCICIICLPVFSEWRCRLRYNLIYAPSTYISLINEHADLDAISIYAPSTCFILNKDADLDKFLIYALSLFFSEWRCRFGHGGDVGAVRLCWYCRPEVHNYKETGQYTHQIRAWN